MAYGCREVAIILRHPKFKKSQSINTFHDERKKVFEPMFVLESTGKDKMKELEWSQGFPHYESYQLPWKPEFWSDLA